MHTVHLPASSNQLQCRSRRHQHTSRPPALLQRNVHQQRQARSAHVWDHKASVSHVKGSKLRLRCIVEGPVYTEEEDFDLLGVKVEQLSKSLQAELRGSSVFLVGMMGTGKSTVGKMLSYCLKYCFFDTDDIIEKYHKGTAVADIFKTEGEDYFRTCETEVIKQLTPYRNCIIATGGGAVIRRDNWAHMQQGIVVWLDGSPDVLAQRVVAQGPQKRPLLYTDGTTADNVMQRTTERLQKLLDERKAMYASADITVSLEGGAKDAVTGAPAPVVLYRILKALDDRIKETNREREARRNFTIQNSGDAASIPTMQVREGPAAATEAAQQ